MYYKMSTLYKKRLYVSRAPLLFSNDRLVVGGSWEAYQRCKDILNVLEVSTICLGQLDAVSKVEIHSNIIDKQLKHYVVHIVHDYVKPELCTYNDKIKNMLDQHAYVISILNILNQSIQ